MAGKAGYTMVCEKCGNTKKQGHKADCVLVRGKDIRITKLEKRVAEHEKLLGMLEAMVVRTRDAGAAKQP